MPRSSPNNGWLMSQEGWRRLLLRLRTNDFGNLPSEAIGFMGEVVRPAAEMEAVDETEFFTVATTTEGMAGESGVEQAASGEAPVSEPVANEEPASE